MYKRMQRKYDKIIILIRYSNILCYYFFINLIVYTLLALPRDENGIFAIFYFHNIICGERVEELIAEVFLPSNNLRWLAQEHDEAIRPSKSRQLISSGIVNLFLSPWRRLIERTFNINITSRKNCVTVKCAPRDKTICWTPRVIIHVGDTDARARYRFHQNDQRARCLRPQNFHSTPKRDSSAKEFRLSSEFASASRFWAVASNIYLDH